MSWERVQTRQQMEEYLRTLQTEDAYAGSSVAGLQRMKARGAEIWLYIGDGFRVCLCCDVLELTGGRRCGRIINSVPAGNITGEDACKLLIRRIRRYFDDQQVTEFRAKTAPEYSSQLMRDTVDAVQDVIWEHQTSYDTPDGRSVFKFERQDSRKSEDELFEGPRRQRRKRGVSDA